MTISIILRPDLGDACRIDHTFAGLIIETGRLIEVVEKGRLVYKSGQGVERTTKPSEAP